MQYKRGRLRNTEKEVVIMPRPCSTTGHERTKSRGEGAWWTKGHMADIWWTHTRQTQEAHTLRTRFEKWTHGGHMADTRRSHRLTCIWRTRFGGAAKRTQGKHKTDTWRTQGRHKVDKGGHMEDRCQARFGGGAKAD